MSDSISTTEMKIVDVNQENVQVVINNNDANNVGGGAGIQPIDMLVQENRKRIKEGNSDEKEVKSEAKGEEETNKAKKTKKYLVRQKIRDINIIRDQVAESLTCCNTWHFRGCFIFFLLVCVTVFFGFVLIVNSYNALGPFALLSLPWVWSFLVITICYILLTMFFIIRWKPYMVGWIKRNYGSRYKTKKHNIVSHLLLKYRKNIGLNGRYYLWKLSLYEGFENWWQYYNLRSVFLCNLPYEITSIICFILIIESGLRAFLFGRKLWGSGTDSIRVIDRDVQILSDMFVDLFFLMLPWAMIFSYGVRLIPSVTLQIVAMPGFSLFGKLRFMLFQAFRANIDQMIIQEENKESQSANRRRQSIYGIDRTTKIEREQNKYFPRWAKMAVCGSSFTYCVMLIATVIIQGTSLSQVDVVCNDLLKDHTEMIWHNGCKIKTPFCKNMFVSSCDCAAVDIKSHNSTMLPDGIVEMTNLRKLAIRNGPLMTLPDNMEKLKKLANIDFEFNRLKCFDVDVSNFLFLSSIYIRFNNITHVHDSFWKHETVTEILANSNIGLRMPLNPKDIYLPNVVYFDIRNNSVLLPSILGKDQLPSIIYLLLDGNKIPQNGTSIETLSSNLAYIGLARCGLKTLPSYLTEFKYLKYLDARDNNITEVPKEVTNWIKDTGIEAYFSGNKLLCENDAENYGKYCEKVCSKYCWSKDGNKDIYCDPSCNSKECDYDGGKCEF
eukprot:g7630.t1